METGEVTLSTVQSQAHPGVVNVSVDMNLVFRVRTSGGTGVVISPFNLENAEQTKLGFMLSIYYPLHSPYRPITSNI